MVIFELKMHRFGTIILVKKRNIWQKKRPQK
jgi:hypothetical protein